MRGLLSTKELHKPWNILISTLPPETASTATRIDNGFILKSLGAICMNDRPMALTVVGLAFAGFLYVLLNPTAVKAANQAATYRWIGFGKKPLWFFRAVGAVGSIASGLALLYIIIVWKSN
jgi:hypothetical protein